MAFVHAEGAFCGHNLPQNGIRPRRGGILWTRHTPEWHSSTQRGLFVDTTFPKMAFVHAEGAWCGCNVLSGRLGRKVTDGKGGMGREPW